MNNITKRNITTMDSKLKKLYLARGFCKGSITRMEMFIRDQMSLSLATVEMLEVRRDKLVHSFKRYESLQLDILELDESDNEDIEATEDIYYLVLAQLNARIKAVHGLVEEAFNASFILAPINIPPMCEDLKVSNDATINVCYESDNTQTISSKLAKCNEDKHEDVVHQFGLAESIPEQKKYISLNCQGAKDINTLRNKELVDIYKQKMHDVKSLPGHIIIDPAMISFPYIHWRGKCTNQRRCLCLSNKTAQGFWKVWSRFKWK